MGLKDQFLQAAYHSPLTEPASFAAPFRDLKSDAYVQPTIEEVMLEALDYDNGPQFFDVFNVLIQAARHKQYGAATLLERMAKTYADYYEENTCDFYTQLDKQAQENNQEQENIYLPDYLY